MNLKPQREQTHGFKVYDSLDNHHLDCLELGEGTVASLVDANGQAIGTSLRDL